jgi:hypothetical protein
MADAMGVWRVNLYEADPKDRPCITLSRGQVLGVGADRGVGTPKTAPALLVTRLVAIVE